MQRVSILSGASVALDIMAFDELRSLKGVFSSPGNAFP
jgi:hypothetical protein